jgi:hypothetical protein
MSCAGGRGAHVQFGLIVGVWVDDTLKSVPVWTPPADRPADYDRAVELRLRAYGRMRKNLVIAVVSRALLGAGLLLLSVDQFERRYALAIVFLVLALVSLGSLVLFQLRWGRWAETAKALLSSAITRRVPAEVVSWKGKNVVLALDGGQWYVRAGAVHRDARQVVARTGAVWLAGPDANGAVVLFIDALPVPVYGQSLTDVPERMAPEAPVVDLPLSFARRLAAIQWIPVGVFLAVLAAFSYDIVDNTFREVYGAFLVVLLILSLARILPILKLPSLVKAGPWQSYQATMHIWRGDPRLTGDLGVTITYPDGGIQPVTVRHASAELVANIADTGLLWVAGTPAPGRTLAVGLPGYPIAAPAKCVENPKLRG